MDKRVINRKIESLRRCIERIKSKIPSSAAVLETDYDIQDIISVNLERAIQQCVDIASHILADYDDVSGQSAAGLFEDLTAKNFLPTAVSNRLAKASGFRNLLVHRYADIDWKRVFDSLPKELTVFSDFVASIVKQGGLDAK